MQQQAAGRRPAGPVGRLARRPGRAGRAALLLAGLLAAALLAARAGPAVGLTAAGSGPQQASASGQVAGRPRRSSSRPGGECGLRC